MNSRSWLIIAAWLLGWAALDARAQVVSSLGPQAAVVLLNNGETLTGSVTRAGDHYLVVLPHGEIRIKVSDVEFVCSTLDEGYRRKRARLIPGEIEGHLILADWCIRHGLFDAAAENLKQAQVINPQHPRLPLVERRLKVEQARSSEPRIDNEPLAKAPTNDDLERLIRGLPAASVEQFSTTIQPLLLNNCTNAGCHGPQSTSKFTLLRLPLSRTASRRLTQLNLLATVEQIRTPSPLESPLLRQATQAHGGMKAPVFGNREALHYQQLAVWALRTSAGSVVPSVEVSPAVAAEPKSGVLLQTIDKPAEGASLPPLKTMVAPEKPKTFVPRDEFDPELFNRQFLPK